MSNLNPYAQYQQTSVETASPTRLVIMLYDGAIRFLSKALPAMEQMNYYEQSYFIGKAQDIIAHLTATLDHEAGGSVADTLADMYVRLYDMLTDANIHDRPEKVLKVINALKEIREAWIEVDRQCNSKSNANNNEAVNVSLAAAA